MKTRDSGEPCCGLCGKTERLTRTPCCGNWICDDADKYVPFSYARNSCYQNHMKYTICASHHHSQGHEGRWQDCAKCRESGPLELYVYHATNDYNFEKLENPPQFEPTHCAGCGVHISLVNGGYTFKDDRVICLACSDAANPEGVREALARAFAGLHEDGTGPDEDKDVFPLGTVAYYGPTMRLATKIAAAILPRPGAEPRTIHRWITTAGDIRDDAGIAHEVAAFFRLHGAKQVVSTGTIMGCPHEEEKDYPLGEQCPHCPFWHNRDRLSLDTPPDGGMTAAEVLTELGTSRSRQPFEALAAADVHRQELVEPLLHALERGLANPEGTPPEEGMLFSYATYLLAKWREPRAYPYFIRWLSLPGESAFDLGGALQHKMEDDSWPAFAAVTFSPSRS